MMFLIMTIMTMMMMFSHDDHDNDDDDVLMILVQMQERRDRVESDLRKESENLALKLENLKQGHSAESEMYRCQYLNNVSVFNVGSQIQIH